MVLTDRLNSSERLQSDIEKKNFIKNIISPRMRDFFRVSNLVYLAPIRDNSSKHKWFRFLTFKINSSLVRKVSQNLKKKKKKSLAWCFSPGFPQCYSVLPVTSFTVCLIDHERSHSNQDHLDLRQNRADQLNTFQSWSVWFYTTWVLHFGLILSDACHGSTCTLWCTHISL